MASELQELFSELNKVAGEEKKKFAEKVKADNDLQSIFSQLSEIKKENDKEKEKLEAKYAVPKIEEAKFNLLDELINISHAVQNPEPDPEPEPEPEPTLAELPKDNVRGERIEVEELSDTVKEILPEEEKKPEPIVELTTKHIKKSKLQEAKEDDKLEREFKRFKELVTRQLESLGGGGAVNIRDLDDVDRTTALVNNKALVYQSSSGKFIGSQFKGTGGYEITGGFLNRSNAITYTQAQADAGTWMRFGFSSTNQLTTDTPYWGNGPDPDEAPHAGTTDYQSVGLFSGSYMPSGVTQMIDYDDDTAYNQALTMSVTTAGVTENLPVTAAIGSYNFKQYKVGDFANIRVDFNVTPHVSNTTLNCALIWSTRDADDNITFTFPLTITPFFFGDNTAGKQVLTRPIFTAYFASQEDINARALFAIKSDNRITVEPFTSLTTVIGR